MKLSNLGLGLAVATSSLVGIYALVSPVSAASVTAENGSFIFNGVWEFKFLYSYGSHQSSFGVDNTTLFSETSTATPGAISGPTTVTYDFGSAVTSKFFLTTLAPASTITSDVPSNPGGAFWIAGALPGSLPSVDPSTGVPFAPSTAFSYFKSQAPSGTLIIGVNDTYTGDRDYNDFIVSARPVPVPAVVPGIALAAAFFGSKALKRNKKNASESVA